MQPKAHEIQAVEARASVANLIVLSTRPWDWLKNTFVLAALFFSKKLFDAEYLLSGLLAFGLFTLASGGVYLLNDIFDREEDRRHPQKHTRPIASGALPIYIALTTAVIFLIGAAVGALMIKPPLGFIIIAYALLNIAYSKWLKHFVIFDVFVIAVGFVIRILAGGIVAEVMVSHWLLICTLLLALFLGFSKRRYELIVLAAEATLHRKVLAEYNPQFLDMMIGIVTSATAVTYILYTVSIETVQRFHTNGLLVTVPFVLYGIFRYLYLVYQKNQGGSPSHSFFIDGPLLGNAVLWIIVSGLIIYTAAP